MTVTLPNHLPGYAYAPTPSGYGPDFTDTPRLVVVHMTDNTATAGQEAHYATTRPRRGATSAHFYVDTAEALGSVPLPDQAWHARRHGNHDGFGIEICGKTGTYPVDAVRRAAQVCHNLAEMAGIPLARLTSVTLVRQGAGICGHDDITQAYPEDHGTHTDPDWTDAQWARFMAWVVNVRVGYRGNDVREVQGALNAHHADPPLQVDGWFGTRTDTAVRAFQQAEGIDVDGIVGPVTRGHLGIL